jgi:hypothetical protein
MTKRRRVEVGGALLAVVLLPAAASATPMGPVYPAPGGNTVVGSGSIGATGGRTFTYTLTDTSGYTDLWWGLMDSDTNPLSIYGPLTSGLSSGTSQKFTLASIAGNEAIWNPANLWTITLANASTVNVQVRYRLDTYDSLGNPASLTPAASIAGLTGSAGAVLDIDLTPAIPGFKATQVFEAFNGSAWVGVDTFYSSLQTPSSCTGCVIKSVNGGFWSDNVAAVPEPPSLGLFGLALLFSSVTFRRRRPAQPD